MTGSSSARSGSCASSIPTPPRPCRLFSFSRTSRTGSSRQKFPPRLAATRHDPARLASFSVYGLTLFLTYFASTFYHGTTGRTKEIFRKLDHVSIYLLIAGTYTPFTVVAL